MGKKKARAKLKAQNIEELRALKAKIPELEVLEFSSYPTLHLRLRGSRSVDFWPSTGRAWVVGDYTSESPIMSPAEAVALAFDHFSDAAHSNLDAEFRSIVG
jgi:hypothetical protein